MKTITSLLAIALTATMLVLPQAAGAEEDEVVQRSHGSDRITTAVAASAEHRETARHALLATAANFPDALSAGALAARLDAPLLLTHSDTLPQAVVNELERLGVLYVWILGGESAVASTVEADLVTRGYVVRRLAGADRYDTAREVSRIAGPADTREVVVALGEHADPEQAWPDAVAAGALAATPERVPTLLTRPDRLPEPTKEALAELETERVLLIGGDTVIAPAVHEELEALGYSVERVNGSSRYETSIALATKALASLDANGHPVVFASGEDFPDALAAGALAAQLNAPLVLVSPADLADTTDRFLREHVGRWTRGVLIGGPSAASDYVVEQLAAAVTGQPPPPPPEPEAEATSHEESGEEEEVTSVFEGEASWYGEAFRGRRTASGEPFNPDDFTAAHRSLPFGTRVRVTNTANGAQVIVRINDRGPYHGGRVIDVSEAAAETLGFRSAGTAWVRCEVLSAD